MNNQESAPLMQWQLRDRTISFAATPLIMGIVNVTPDSFSDGGLYQQTQQAVSHALRLVEQGADILDIGGESTRPGAEAVSSQEEIQRVVPVVKELVNKIEILISIDTSKAEVARLCLETGAHIINDVTSLTGDNNMAKVIADNRAGVILMHMQGTPRTMQDNPHYEDVIGDLKKFFQERIYHLQKVGISESQMVLDPGIGFGKTLEHNLELLNRLAEFQSLGRPICLGVSRKSFMGKVLNRPVDQRMAGSLAVLCHAMSREAVQIVRVHDVGEARDAVAMWKVINQSTDG